MELIVGGSFQGKLSYAKEQWLKQGICVLDEQILEGACMPSVIPSDIKILNHMHLFVKDMVKRKKEELIFPVLENLCEKNPDIIILCDEVGCGIVPIEKEERDYREQTGRVLCRLAKKCVHMERLVAGMPIRIK